MNFKKKVSGSWVDAPYYLKGTDTETITTLPATIYPLAQTATIGLKGNTAQNGTPTPTNPIYPSETGDKTANLFDLNREQSTVFTVDTTKWMIGAATTSAVSYSAEATVSNNKVVVTSFSGGHGACFFISAKPNTSYTLSFTSNKTSSGSYFGYSFRESDGTIISNGTGDSTSFTLVTPTNTAYLYICLRYPPTDGEVEFSNIMLNEGSTALPYEPYGYKIPILSANTTTPVYLGEVESTRKVRKRVLTGQEAWSFNDATGVLYTFDINDFLATEGITCACSHYPAQANANGVSEVQNKHVCFRASTYNQFYLKDTDFNSADALKSYLAAQYAAGTPVTVWYVLAEPTTGIVNEPLMKIGDYADTVSNVSIPVTAGGDTISVGTTVQPSEVTVNYKGWHPVANVHERESGAWT